MFRSNAANSDDEKDIQDQLNVMHELGAPWSWMFEFVEHNAPASKSYNFIEICGMETADVPYVSPIVLDGPHNENAENAEIASDLPDTESIERKSSQVDANVPIMPGIGKSTSEAIAHEFLNYVRYRSIDENGMIFPRHFKEADCPKMSEN